MKSIIVQKHKPFADSMTNNIKLLAVEVVEVDFVLEKKTLTPLKTFDFDCTDGHWQDIMKANPGIRFSII